MTDNFERREIRGKENDPEVISSEQISETDLPADALGSDDPGELEVSEEE